MKNLIRSSVKNPCPVCDRTKDSDCSWYPDGRTVLCKTHVDGMGHDESTWHYNGVNELGFQGKFVLKTEPEFVKPPRPKGTKSYYYPSREGENLVRVDRIDRGNGKKDFYQKHWDGSKWVNGNPDEVKQLVPIYRYVEVQRAISCAELIFIVEGEAAADALWERGIAATTTLGGSGSFTKYGNYENDLNGARLILSPDRAVDGIKYISNFQDDFPTQIVGWYLAGTAGLWQNPQGGMDIHDDIRDYDYSKEQILERVIDAAAYQELITPQLVDEELLELPVEDGKLYFTSSWEDGLNRETMESTPKGDVKRVRKLIGNHITAVGYVKNPEGGGTGVLLEFRTQRHELQRLVIPRTALIGDGLDALRAIVDRGYHYNLDSRKCLLAYLFGLGGEIERVYIIADKTGWVNGSFLTPAQTYGDPNLRFRDPEPDNSMTEIKGTLAEWKSEVAGKCAGNSRLIFGLGTAFAAPLLEPAQIESGGFHLAGITSKGKTTTLSVVASVSGLKSIPNWLSTANALEGTAAEFNHGLLPLDEIGQAMDAGVLGASAYMLGNGRGKARMTKKLTNSPPKTWQLLFLSTGEFTMAEYFRRDKISIKGGQEARMPSIPADAGRGYGVFEDIHDYKDAMAFVTALETSVRQQQGTALDAYLTQLVEGRKVEGFDKELRERVHLVAGQLSERFNDSAIGRVAVRFALVQVGLELASSYGLLPFPVEQCGWAVKRMFEAWVNVRGGEGSIEIKEACNRIEHLFVSNQHNSDRIADAQSPQGTRNLLAYRSNDPVTNGIEYWVPTPIFNTEFTNGVSKSELVKELQARGWLKSSLDPEHLTRERRIAGKKYRFFIFNQFWNDEKSPETPETPETVVKNDSVQDFQTVSGTGDTGDSTGDTGDTLSSEDKEDGNSPMSVSGVSGSENQPETDRRQQKPSNSSTFDGLSPVSPVSPVKNHVSEKTSKKNHPFKVGDKVQYIGNSLNLLQQYTGVLSIFEISGDTYTCLKSDGKLTSWIELDELRLVK